MIMIMMMALLRTEYVKLQQKCTKLERDLAVVSAQVRLRIKNKSQIIIYCE